MPLTPVPYSERTDHNGYDGYIDAITLPTGTKYEIVDTGAREQISGLSSYSSFLGVVSDTRTVITDGTTTATVYIGSQIVTANAGNIIIYTAGSSTAA